ncbi:MAG: glycosyltransferase family 2 protein [Acidimicrobiales bacterium]|nr:glycosyltransferase family 2 protein [Acidimicrobiales bacterium]RZV48829.1 MAG: glycosyltransferase family 2 protein [Acidimicrobiales bacterium]
MAVISTIVATRDRPELLRQTLASIANQTYDGVIETCVVFDQTEPDMSLEVADGNRPVRVLRNERQPGLQGARNTGLLNTNGELVAFCDDDDVWAPSKIRRQVELLSGNPDVHFVGSGVIVEYVGESVTRVRDESRITFRDLLRSRVFEAHPSTFLMRRRELIDVIGLIDEAVPGGYGEDYEWLLRATRETDLLLVPAPLVTVRWHTASFYAERWQMRIDGLQYILDRFPEFETEPVGLARIKGQMAFAKASLGDRKAAFSLAKETLKLNPKEARAGLALAVAAGVPSATVVSQLQKRGNSV